MILIDDDIEPEEEQSFDIQIQDENRRPGFNRSFSFNSLSQIADQQLNETCLMETAEALWAFEDDQRADLESQVTKPREKKIENPEEQK